MNSLVYSAENGSVPSAQGQQPAAPVHQLGDILGMALRGEITPETAQEMANERQAILGTIGA